MPPQPLNPSTPQPLGGPPAASGPLAAATGESILDPAESPLRVFEPREVMVVVGRAQQAEREADLAACAADGILVHQRLSGGGAVVLAPGMLVLAVRLPPAGIDPDRVFAAINAAVIPVVEGLGGPRLVCRGHGDLAVVETESEAAGSGEGASPAERKVLGASLRLNRQGAHYLGVLLCADVVPLMRRYLRHPSREPTYRGGRDHGDFCTHLGRWGLSPARLQDPLAAALLPLTQGAPAAAPGCQQPH